jgi:hypothetical protein
MSVKRIDIDLYLKKDNGKERFYSYSWAFSQGKKKLRLLVSKLNKKVTRLKKKKKWRTVKEKITIYLEDGNFIDELRFDELLERLANKDLDYYYEPFNYVENIVFKFGKEVLFTWERKDPLCSLCKFVDVVIDIDSKKSTVVVNHITKQKNERGGTEWLCGHSQTVYDSIFEFNNDFVRRLCR